MQREGKVQFAQEPSSHESDVAKEQLTEALSLAVVSDARCAAQEPRSGSDRFGNVGLRVSRREQQNGNDDYAGNSGLG